MNIHAATRQLKGDRGQLEENSSKNPITLSFFFSFFPSNLGMEIQIRLDCNSLDMCGTFWVNSCVFKSNKNLKSGRLTRFYPSPNQRAVGIDPVASVISLQVEMTKYFGFVSGQVAFWMLLVRFGLTRFSKRKSWVYFR